MVETALCRHAKKATVFAANLDGDERIEHDLGPIQRAWLQDAGGSVRLNDELLKTGDGVVIQCGGMITLDKGQQVEVLLFELP